MHIDDAHDDKMVAEETALQVHSRAQSRAAQTVSIIEATSPSPCSEPTADPINQPTESVMLPRSAHESTHATNASGNYTCNIMSSNLLYHVVYTLQRHNNDCM